MYEFKKDMDKYYEDKNEDRIFIDTDNKNRYFEVLNKINDVNSKTVAYTTPKVDINVIEEETEDVDEKRLEKSRGIHNSKETKEEDQ